MSAFKNLNLIKRWKYYFAKNAKIALSLFLKEKADACAENHAGPLSQTVLMQLLVVIVLWLDSLIRHYIML